MTSMKFKLPDDLKDALAAHAERESESEATIIRRALREYLTNHAATFKLMARTDA